MAVVQGLEIRAGGIWQGVTQHIYDAEWVQGVNVSDQLTFTVPTAEVDEFLDIGAQVYLRRGDDADLHRIFVIEEIEVKYGERQETTFTCYDLLHWLGKVVLTEDYPPDPWGEDHIPKVHGTNYPKGAPKPPRTIRASTYVSGLLAYQSYVTFGGMGASYDLELEYDDVFVEAGTTLLDALQRLRDLIGGMIHVRDAGGLYWYSRRWINSPPECVLGTDNIISYTKRTDSSGADTQYSYDIDVADLSQIVKSQSGTIAVGARLTFGPESLWITDIRQKLDAPIRARISGSSSLDATGRGQDLTEYLNDIAARNAANAHKIELLEKHLDQGLQYDPDGAGPDDGPYPYADERYITDVSDGVIDADTDGEVAGYVGTQNEVARADHRHYVRYGVDEEISYIYGSDRNNGSRDAVARADHTHPVSYATRAETVGGSINLPGTEDRIAREDHIHALDYGQDMDIQPVGETAAAGTSDKVARADHVHVGGSGGSVDEGDVEGIIEDIMDEGGTFGAWGTNIKSVGTSNKAGTSKKWTRSDHVHKLEYGDDDDIENVGTINDSGKVDKPARADHRHGSNYTTASVKSIGDGPSIRAYCQGREIDVIPPSWLTTRTGTVSFSDGTSVTYTEIDDYTRSALYKTVSEIQRLLPAYYEGERLAVLLRDDDVALDLNSAGRAWYAIAEEP
jgi:hypothetical protein